MKRFLCAAFLLTFAPFPASAGSLPETPPIPSGARALGGDRYESSRTYEDTLDYYERILRRTGGGRWYTVVNLPGTKAKHLKSLQKKTLWEGINIYEHRGRVRIYVLMRPEGGSGKT